jgi:hypothetical protein
LEIVINKVNQDKVTEVVESFKEFKKVWDARNNLAPDNKLMELFKSGNIIENKTVQ